MINKKTTFAATAFLCMTSFATQCAERPNPYKIKQNAYREKREALKENDDMQAILMHTLDQDMQRDRPFLSQVQKGDLVAALMNIDEQSTGYGVYAIVPAIILEITRRNRNAERRLILKLANGSVVDTNNFAALTPKEEEEAKEAFAS